MIITLTGSNSFALLRELKKFTLEASNNFGDLAVEQIDCSEAEPASIKEALLSLPFLSPKKLIVLRQALSNSNLSQQMPEIIEQLPETTDLIVVEENIDKRTSLYKLLKSQTDFREFNELNQPALASWAISYAKEKGTSLTSSDARYLVERLGLNQEKLSNELDKLALYDNSITKTSIDLLTEPSPNSSIFDLLEAAFSGNRKKAIRLYDEQRQLKVEPQQIMSMITWQLHVLSVVKAAGDKPSDGIAREAGLNPFVVRKSQAVVRDLSLGRISQLVDNLLKIDVKAKTKNIDLDDSLTHYLLSI